MSKLERTLILSRALPEFQNLSEEAVWRALGSESEDGDVTMELKRLVAAFLREVRAHVNSHSGEAAASALEVKVCCPIEKIALQMLVRHVGLRAGAR